MILSFLKTFEVTVSSAPFYFNAEIDSDIVINQGELANLVIKNNNGIYIVSINIPIHKNNDNYVYYSDLENAILY